MKRLLLLSSAALFAVGAARAADLPSYDMAPSAPMAVSTAAFDWSGFYAGIHGGYAWGDYEFDLGPEGVDPTDSDEFDANGWLGGLQAGYNVQFNNSVVGLEGDVSWTGIDGDSDVGLPNGDFSAETDWLGTLRARAGFGFDRFLVYGTGGLAFASTEASLSDFNGVAGANEDDQDSVWGWAIGAGAEVALTNNVSVKAEYLYMDFEDAEYSFSDAGTTFDADAEFDAHAVKLGVNYQF